jgi:transcriptional regulator with XRE-family HTH domain
MTFTIVLDIDPNDGEVSAWSEIDGGLLTTIAENTEGAVKNIRMLIENFRQNEWKDEPHWADVDVNLINFDYQYSVVSFFDAYKTIKISEMAKLAGLNPALVRAYANGDKNPSLAQAKKIEEAAHRLAESLLRARLVPQSAD